MAIYIFAANILKLIVKIVSTQKTILLSVKVHLNPVHLNQSKSTISTHEFILKKENKRYFSSNTIATTSAWINKDISAPYFLLTSAVLANEAVVLKDTFALPIVSDWKHPLF